MELTPRQQSALHQLAAVPGVVGGMVFDPAGAVVASGFPPVFDPSGLEQLAGQLSSDGYFLDWVRGEAASLDLRYGDGRVVVRTVDDQWLLVLCTPQANAQLLAMSLTQVVRRLKTGDGAATGELPLAAATARPAPAPPERGPSTVERLKAAAREQLGSQSSKALDILSNAGTSPAELLQAVADVENMTRLFISKKKADELGKRLRELLILSR
jgi:predicted regulator of Ras-like GTPase activity (Roadblock/LC7/MglB family)